MNKRDGILGNEKGFVLVISLLILLILVIVGITALNTTTIELQIAGNDKVHKQTFYAAEAGAELGVEVIEQNVFCADGFKSTSTVDSVDVADLEGTIRVFERNSNELALYQNPLPPSNDICDIEKADIAFPLSNYAAGSQATYLYVGGETKMSLGGSLQMAAGYEGKGKSAAGGGVVKMYDIYSQHEGLRNSQSIVQLGWRYPVGWAGDCNY
ncbi:MAG: PilX N-terminal domain-containing pilus assembly protein [Spirochaetales bacterium]|jgi:Na+-transporting methylmalonyl-CoA/oxaloacetate decarboxylase gamma subunit|nr:PilX N-terminal domain-containing pilus assembly protein [Spirochaetales bacterium]